jgi:hypothetical protein
MSILATSTMSMRLDSKWEIVHESTLLLIKELVLRNILEKVLREKTLL